MTRRRSMPASEMRRRLGITQAQVAARMGITQGRVSAIEQAKPGTTELRTLAAYVEALGGCLEIIADFGDQRLAFIEPVSKQPDLISIHDDQELRGQGGPGYPPREGSQKWEPTSSGISRPARRSQNVLPGQWPPFDSFRR
jgi:transcriptional regulator with XRE-family HTH domain